MASKHYTHPDFGNIIISKRRGSKTIRLRVSPDGGVRISLPMWVPYSAGLSFLEQKRRWVQEELANRNSVLEPGQIIGRDHVLRFIPDESLLQTRVQTTATEVRVRHPVSCSAYDPMVQAAAVRGSKKALQRQAEEVLPKRLMELSEITGLDYDSVSVRHLKSRWGSCSSNRHITLNYFLMVLPDALIDYVLVHELAHTRHMNHSREFWNLVGSYIGNLTAIRRQIRSHQPSVFAAQA